MGSELNGWDKYQKLVLSELKRLNKEVTELHSVAASIRIDIATLKVKSGVWGAMGALIPIVIFILFETWLSKFPS